MADSNYDLIKPVENLQNVGGLTPVQQRKERNRRRNPQQENPEEYAEDLKYVASDPAAQRRRVLELAEAELPPAA